MLHILLACSGSNNLNSNELMHMRRCSLIILHDKMKNNNSNLNNSNWRKKNTREIVFWWQLQLKLTRKLTCYPTAVLLKTDAHTITIIFKLKPDHSISVFINVLYCLTTREHPLSKTLKELYICVVNV